MYRYNCLKLLVAAIAATAAPLTVAEMKPSPLAISNKNPFVQAYGVPEAESGELTSAGELRLDLRTEVAHSWTVTAKTNESIVIDGETYRANLSLRWGVTESWELGLDAPYVGHDGGGLDSFIEDFHDLFDMPNGDRELYPRNRLLYYYARNGQTELLINEGSDGWGDVRLSAGYQWSSSPGRSVALRGSVELPTGDADKLRGSDSTDYTMSLSYTDRELMADWNITMHAGGGVLLSDNGQILNDIREDTVYFGYVAWNWQMADWLYWTLQMDAHSAMYESDLRELGFYAAQLTIGVSALISENWQLDFSFSEDMVVDSSPDANFQLVLRRRF